MASALEEKLKESKAASNVRKVVQRLRLATPDTLETLQIELMDAMDANLGELGSLYDVVQAESEQVLEIATQRVADILAKQEIEALTAARPLDLIEELKCIVEVFESKTETLVLAARLDTTQLLRVEETADVDTQIGEYNGELQTFREDVKQWTVSHSSVVKAPGLPALVGRKLAETMQRVDALTRGAAATILRSRVAIKDAEGRERREALEKAKQEVRDQVTDASQGYRDAEAAVRLAEDRVVLFSKGRRRPMDQLKKLAEEADEAIAVSHLAIRAGRESFKVEHHTVAEEFREELEAFLRAETKLLQLRCGQLYRRVERTQNLVTQFRRSVQKARNLELIEELKTQALLDKVATANVTEAFVAVEPTIKTAEDKVDLCRRAFSKLTPEELKNLDLQVTEATKLAKAAMDAARDVLLPIGKCPHKSVRRALRVFVADAAKKHVQKLGQQERRLTRVVNLLAQFQAQLTKKRQGAVDKARGELVELVRSLLKCGESSIEDAFASIFPTSSTGVNAEQFLAFVGGLDDELEKPEDADLRLLLESLLPADGGGITRDALVKHLALQMQVIRATPLTPDLAICQGKTIRQLKEGEILEVLDGPTADTAVKVQRVKVCCVSDRAVGWATVCGSAGTAFLEDCK